MLPGIGAEKSKVLLPVLREERSKLRPEERIPPHRRRLQNLSTVLESDQELQHDRATHPDHVIPPQLRRQRKLSAVLEVSSDQELQQKDWATHPDHPVKVATLGRRLQQTSEPVWVSPIFAPMTPADPVKSTQRRRPRRRLDGVLHTIDLFSQFEAALSETQAHACSPTFASWVISDCIQG